MPDTLLVTLGVSHPAESPESESVPTARCASKVLPVPLEHSLIYAPGSYLLLPSSRLAGSQAPAFRLQLRVPPTSLSHCHHAPRASPALQADAPGVQVRAALGILTHAFRGYELLDLSARLEAIEAREEARCA